MIKPRDYTDCKKDYTKFTAEST